MKHTIEFETGETTCAVEPGRFCQFLGAKSFGTKPVCMLFGDTPLYANKDGWVARCSDCLRAFSKEKSKMTDRAITSGLIEHPDQLKEHIAELEQQLAECQAWSDAGYRALETQTKALAECQAKEASGFK